MAGNEYFSRIEADRWCIINALKSYDDNSDEDLPYLLSRMKRDLEALGKKKSGRKFSKALTDMTTKIDIFNSLRCVKSLNSTGETQEHHLVANFADQMNQSFHFSTVRDKNASNAVAGPSQQTGHTRPRTEEHDTGSSAKKQRTNDVNLASPGQFNTSTLSMGFDNSSSPTSTSSPITPSLADNIDMNENTQQYAKWVIEYERMGLKEQLLYLYNNHGGIENHLDLNQLNPAPSKRKAKIIRRKTKALKYSYMVTKEEAGYLGKISNCGNLEDMLSLRTSMFEIDDASEGLEYIRTAVHHALLLWQNEHGYSNNLESWWRSFVYAPFLDTVFMFLEDYNVIRSESESTVFKEYAIVYKDIVPGMVKHKIDKVDLAIRTLDNKMDIFTAEDKPLFATQKAINDTIKKNRDRRVVTLDVLQKQLPKPDLIEYFEVYTALWYGNTMTIDCTRKMGDIYYHYETARTFFPLTGNNFDEFSRMLMLVLSLKRHVIVNHRQLNAFTSCSSHLGIEDGIRSPIHLDDNDDSIEYDEEDAINVLKDIMDDEKKELKRYEEVAKQVKNQGEEIIFGTTLHKILQAGSTDSIPRKLNHTIYEGDADITVLFEVPGVVIENIEVSAYPPSQVQVTATRSQLMQNKKLVKTTTSDIFDSTITLPAVVDFTAPNKVHIKDGVLSIVLRKVTKIAINLNGDE